jgi:hypothetical protein
LAQIVILAPQADIFSLQLFGAALRAAAPFPPGGGGAKRFLQALSLWA